jgi:peptidoglycan glycosyltransferase
MPDAPNYPMTNFGGGGCGSDPVTLADSLRVSCNTSFGQLGMDLGGDALRTQAEDFGFGAELHIPMSVTPSRFPDELNQPETAQSAIGQFNVQATPLQMVMVSAAVANDGQLMTPYLVQQRVRASDASVIYTAEPTVFSRPISSSTAAALTDMMVQVVERGSATEARIRGVAVAAKTGTAQTTPGQPPHVWFTGFAPADNPQVAVVVFIDHGGNMGNDATGGKAAAPLARAVIEAVLNQ